MNKEEIQSILNSLEHIPAVERWERLKSGKYEIVLVASIEELVSAVTYLYEEFIKEGL